jgi:transposase
MGEHSEAFVAFDTAKVKHAVAIADGGRGGEVRFVGEVASTPVTVERLIRKLAGRYKKLHFCYEAGPTGYGLYRQIRALGHDCTVVAPSLIPQKPGERVKNNRRDAVTLARLLRAGELTAVWVPDATHEAVRDLVRAREAAAQDLRRKRQQLLSFLLRHGRIFETRRHWTMAHRRWLADQKFEHPAQQIVFQDAIDAIADAAARLQRLEQQLLAIAPSWSMAPVVAAYQAMRGASFLVAVTFAGRDRRCAPLPQPAPIDGLSRPGAARAVDRREGAAFRAHPGRQPPSSPRAGRSRLELSPPGAGQPNLAGPPGRLAQGHPRHRLEGATAPLRPLSTAQRRRQEAAGGNRRRGPRMAAFLWAIGHQIAPA